MYHLRIIQTQLVYSFTHSVNLIRVTFRSRLDLRQNDKTLFTMRPLSLLTPVYSHSSSPQCQGRLLTPLDRLSTDGRERVLVPSTVSGVIHSDPNLVPNFGDGKGKREGPREGRKRDT